MKNKRLFKTWDAWNKDIITLERNRAGDIVIVKVNGQLSETFKRLLNAKAHVADLLWERRNPCVDA